jgi:molybdopterin synthase sulfur carrier subunit
MNLESAATTSIRVLIPFHLRNLAGIIGELTLEITGPVTQRAVIDALEARFPQIRGAIRDHGADRRRPFLRFFACKRDLSNEPPDALLPDEVIAGKETFMIIGGLAGG